MLKISGASFMTIPFWIENVSAQVKRSVANSDTLMAGTQITELNSNIDFLGLFLKSVGAFILVSILIFATVYILRQFYKLKSSKGFNANFINIIGSTFLSPKKSIYLVEICEKILVLGVTDTDISILTEFNKDELELDLLKIDSAYQENSKFKGFPEYLTQVFGKIGKRK
jgi:flagellar protein FliO/FliZ